ncbi:MAG: tetratricopeptide repeat protein [Chitinophagaceae bacterium]
MLINCVDAAMVYSTKKCSLIFISFFCFYLSDAQSTKEYNDPDAQFKLAKELYQKDEFSLAYPLFKTLNREDQNAESSIPISVQEESKYYLIVCLLKLNDTTAEQPAKDFINLEHNAPRTEMMSYNLAEYYFRKQNFTDAIAFYEKAGVDNLSNAEISQMKFHEGYAYFTMQRFNDAKPLFDAIRQIPTDENYIDANYYYGFISFYQKNYNDALNSFKIVADKPNYQKVVPYYIAVIYYYNGDEEKAIEYSEAALQKGNQYYDLQFRELLGTAYFERKQFTKALPYLEAYVTNTPKVSREDLYELSYCYYVTKQWQKAIDGFKELGGKQDSLAQNSMYLLADAYLKTNQKASARSAFLFCELNSSNAQQKEISQFNYGKLSYELGYTDVALTELQSFVSTYPNSNYNAEAKELLVNVLANTNNYKDALTLFESIHSQNETVLRAYPKILYGRAVELINDQQIFHADSLLNKIFSVPYNESQIQPTYFWKGEIAYRNNVPDSAIDYLIDYLRNPVNYGEVNVTNARYTLGYAYMKVEDYASALKSFEQITTSVSPSSTNIQQDAFVRSADCYFMQKKYAKALQMYQNIINQNLAAADYAYYQTAVIAGANNNLNEKINLLKSFALRYQSSNLVADANLEQANTFMGKEDFKDAIIPLNNILANKKSEALKPQAYLNLGVCYFNLNNDDEALKQFQTLVSQYPNSPESDDAVEYIRNIFLNRQQPGEYVNFMRKNGKNVSYSEEDSLSFISASARYNSKDYNNALNDFSNYLTKFPDGKYSIDAHFFSAEIYNARKDFRNALTHYDAVAAKAPNKFAEAAVLQAARINYFELKDYAKAEQYFLQLKSLATTPDNRLESMRGLLRCQYKLSQWTDAVQNAQDLLQQKGIATDDKQIANMVVAKNYQTNNQLSEATAAYQSVISLGKSEYAAEARYRIAEILLSQNRLQDAEKAGFDVIKKAGSYDYWITKAYILLGDVYYAEKDYFNAEATLKSVVANASDAILKQEAQQKLVTVTEEENKTSKVQQ